MRTVRTSRFFVGMVAAASTALLAAPAALGAETEGLPGMCSAGVPSPLRTLNAHANGSTKFILNLDTDEGGDPTGVLILGRGADRIYTSDLCNYWEHVPGQEPGGGGHEGGGEEVPEGATMAHAVGIGYLGDGTKILVRADIRETDDSASFRVRYRVMGQHGEDEGTEGDDHEAWTWVPAETWSPLDRLNLR